MRYYVQQHIYLPCGHPNVCLEKRDHSIEPLCGWCEDVADAQRSFREQAAPEESAPEAEVEQ